MRSRTTASVRGMKLQMVALFGLAAYMIWTSTFAGMMVGVVPSPGM